ncbi:hypothetical protein ALNOE001_22080 [Candidatus Methanobinarius endosymbioticus]|uniref:Uncharacterized protein n=1 Tax=Candidatus Methanobinarius endosymbioticus TaxID=2006182 RepID=A0A366M9P8_9EURY|nr:hypothetical protein ALNOE001_22080 [Candidatus Methanobinarius endosymbioticus]
MDLISFDHDMLNNFYSGYALIIVEDSKDVKLDNYELLEKEKLQTIIGKYSTSTKTPK